MATGEGRKRGCRFARRIPLCFSDGGVVVVNIPVVEAQVRDPGGHPVLAALGPLLADTLPPGAAVAVGWDDPLLGGGISQGGRGGAAPAAAAATLLAGGA
ncbi:hypothetical protein, partial [Luteimonas sp. SDU101]|uniref:hypothetical protein n=1 Tax=Luteimonas sp. SDU101 TaxID=3422593 RepID=UPI003EB86425